MILNEFNPQLCGFKLLKDPDDKQSNRWRRENPTVIISRISLPSGDRIVIRSDKTCVESAPWPGTMEDGLLLLDMLDIPYTEPDLQKAIINLLVELMLKSIDIHFRIAMGNEKPDLVTCRTLERELHSIVKYIEQLKD